MKKNYLSISEMAKDLFELEGKSSHQYAMEILSRLKLEEHQTTIEIEGVKHTVSYFKTPDKFLN